VVLVKHKQKVAQRKMTIFIQVPENLKIRTHCSFSAVDCPSFKPSHTYNLTDTIRNSKIMQPNDCESWISQHYASYQPLDDDHHSYPWPPGKI